MTTAAEVTGEERKASRREAYQRRQKRALKYLPVMAILLFVALGFTTNYIPSTSMEPGLRPGDHVLLVRSWLAYPLGRMPARGDVVTFFLPKDKEKLIYSDMPDEAAAATAPPDSRAARALEALKNFRKNILIKRVIGLPGDVVSCDSNTIKVNGQPLKEDYATVPDDLDMQKDYQFAVAEPYKVPAGEVFLLGDNRDNSEDSRFWGSLKREFIVGKYLRMLWHEEPKPEEGGDPNAPTDSSPGRGRRSFRNPTGGQ